MRQCLKVGSNIQPDKVASISFGGIWGNARIFFFVFSPQLVTFPEML